MSMQCLPVKAGGHTLVIPMRWVMNVQQVSDELHRPPAEEEHTLPLLDVSAWVGGSAAAARRFAVVVGTPEQALCLLVDGVLPARTASAFTRLPAGLHESPFSAFWEPDPTEAPLPVIDIPDLLNATHREAP
jgi:hypothetical protein